MKKKVVIISVLAILLAAVLATGVLLKVKHDKAEAEALRLAAEAFEIGGEPPAVRPLILSVVTEDGIRRG